MEMELNSVVGIGRGSIVITADVGLERVGAGFSRRRRNKFNLERIRRPV